MTSTPRFEVGDRVRLIEKADSWRGYGDEATVQSLRPKGATGWPSTRRGQIYGIRIDGYRYSGAGPDDCHTVEEHVLEPVDKSERELADVKVRVRYWVEMLTDRGAWEPLTSRGTEADARERASHVRDARVVKRTTVSAEMEEVLE